MKPETMQSPKSSKSRFKLFGDSMLSFLGSPSSSQKKTAARTSCSTPATACSTLSTPSSGSKPRLHHTRESASSFIPSPPFANPSNRGATGSTAIPAGATSSKTVGRRKYRVFQEGKLLYEWEQSPIHVTLRLPSNWSSEGYLRCLIAPSSLQVGMLDSFYGNKSRLTWHLHHTTGGSVNVEQSSYLQDKETIITLCKAQPGSSWTCALLHYPREETQTIICRPRRSKRNHYHKNAGATPTVVNIGDHLVSNKDKKCSSIKQKTRTSLKSHCESPTPKPDALPIQKDIQVTPPPDRAYDSTYSFRPKAGFRSSIHKPAIAPKRKSASKKHSACNSNPKPCRNFPKNIQVMLPNERAYDSTYSLQPKEGSRLNIHEATSVKRSSKSAKSNSSRSLATSKYPARSTSPEPTPYRSLGAQGATSKANSSRSLRATTKRVMRSGRQSLDFAHHPSQDRVRQRRSHCGVVDNQRRSSASTTVAASAAAKSNTTPSVSPIMHQIMRGWTTGSTNNSKSSNSSSLDSDFMHELELSYSRTNVLVV